MVFIDQPQPRITEALLVSHDMFSEPIKVAACFQARRGRVILTAICPDTKQELLQVGSVVLSRSTYNRRPTDAERPEIEASWALSKLNFVPLGYEQVHFAGETFSIKRHAEEGVV